MLMESIPTSDPRLLSSLENVRNIVQQSFSSATQELATSRARKIHSNVKAARRFSARLNSRKEFEHVCERNENKNAPKSCPSSSSIFAIPNRSEQKVLLESVSKCPSGLSWVRVRTNMRAADQGKDNFFVPYIGESDKHLNFSNKLAADTFELDERVPDDVSDIEDVDGEDEQHPDTLVVESLQDNTRSNQISKNMKGAELHLSVPTKKKLSECVWKRAAMRVALKHILEVLDCSSLEPIAGIACDAFGLVSKTQLATCATNIAYRQSKYDETDREEQAKKKYRTEMIQIIKGSVKPRPSEILKGDSIPFFVCRQCYAYNCILHGNHTAKPSVTIPDKTRKDSSNRQISLDIESKCEDKMKKKCWHIDGSLTESESWWRDVERDSGKAADVRALLLELHGVFGADPCRIASSCKFLLASYSKLELTCCRVGYIFSAIEGLPSVESKQKSRRRFRKSPYSVDSTKSKRKKMRMEDESGLRGGLRRDFEPCKHPGPCTAKSCPCYLNGVNCEKYCSCNHTRSHQDRQDRKLTCPNAFKGCSCKSSAACVSNACICYSWKRECDPDLCKACHECKEGQNGKSCQNDGLLMGRKQRVVVGHSDTHGWGAYATSSIGKNEVIGEYVGEIVDQEHADRRGRLYDEVQYSFLFNITDDYALDSTRIGNKLRYCNHAFEPNCEARLMRVAGDIRVGLYAKRDIAQHEELFFDYKYKSGPDWAVPSKDKKRIRARKEKHSAPSAMKRASSSLGEKCAAPNVKNGKTGSTDEPPVDLKTKRMNVVREFIPVRTNKKKEEEPRQSMFATAENSNCEEHQELEKQRRQSSSADAQPVERPLSVWRGVLRRVVPRAAHGVHFAHSVSKQRVSSPGSRKTDEPCSRRDDETFSHQSSRVLTPDGSDKMTKTYRRGREGTVVDGVSGESEECHLNRNQNRSSKKRSLSLSSMHDTAHSNHRYMKQVVRKGKILKLAHDELKPTNFLRGSSEGSANGSTKESGRDQPSTARSRSLRQKSFSTSHANDTRTPDSCPVLPAKGSITKQNSYSSPTSKSHESNKRRQERLNHQIKIQRLIMRRRLKEIFGSDDESDEDSSDEGSKEPKGASSADEDASSVPKSGSRKRRLPDLHDHKDTVSTKRRRATLRSSEEQTALNKSPTKEKADFGRGRSFSFPEHYPRRNEGQLSPDAVPTSRTTEKVEGNANRIGQANIEVRQTAIRGGRRSSTSFRKTSSRREVTNSFPAVHGQSNAQVEQSIVPKDVGQSGARTLGDRSRQMTLEREWNELDTMIEQQYEPELRIPMVNLVSEEESDHSNGSFDPKFI